MDISKAESSLSRIIEATRTQLHIHRESGVSDEDFVLRLLHEFVKLRQEMSPDAGSMHMALSCYHMAVLTDCVQELEERAAFYKDSIDMLLDMEKI